MKIDKSCYNCESFISDISCGADPDKIPEQETCCELHNFIYIKRVSFRIRRIYYDQIVNGTKVVELRKFSDYWKRILLGNHPPKIAVFVCGKDVHRRWIKDITIGIPEQILGRELSEQGKKDIPTDKCIAIWLGDIYKPQEKY